MRKQKKKFEGDSPVNARIKIDYRGKSPTVKFTYPDKKHQVHGGMFPVICMWWFMFLGLLLVGYTLSVNIHTDILTRYHSPEVQRFTSCVSYYETHFNDVIGKTCELSALNKSYTYPKWTLLTEDSGASPASLLKALELLAVFFLPPIIIFYPFKKKWQNFYPVYQAWMSSKKFKKFTPKEIIQKDGMIYCELPLFKNILLNYKATKDFSRYLDYFEIHEYPFKYSKIKMVYDNKKKKKVRKDIGKVNEWMWYARFYFKEVPKRGILEVTFR